MIDNVKLTVLDKNRFEKHLVEKTPIELKSSFCYETGIYKMYPRKGCFYNLDIRLTENNAFLSGSLHKFKNQLYYSIDHNYDDYDYCELVDNLDLIRNELDLTDRTKLTNLEFGFNIHVMKSPAEIINNNLILFDLKNHNRNLNYRGTGNFKEFIKSDYSLKVYDKGKQYKQDDHILRVELKITRSRKLNQLGVYNFENLFDKAILSNLFIEFINTFNKTIIIDDYRGLNISENLKQTLEEYTNPNYWISIRNENNYKKFDKLRTEFNQIILENNLCNLKNEIQNKLTDKFYDLLFSDCREEYSEVA